MSDKTILEQWRAIAYDQQADRNKLQQFWAKYFNIEKNIYAQLLENPDEVVTGTVKELAEKYNQEVLTMVGFLDGINDSLKVQNPIETMDENTTVSLCFDKELLYKNMVDAKADWLYNLPQWDKIFTPEKLKEIILRRRKGEFPKSRRRRYLPVMHLRLLRHLRQDREHSGHVPRGHHHVDHRQRLPRRAFHRHPAGVGAHLPAPQKDPTQA